MGISVSKLRQSTNKPANGVGIPFGKVLCERRKELVLIFYMQANCHAIQVGHEPMMEADVAVLHAKQVTQVKVECVHVESAIKHVQDDGEVDEGLHIHLRRALFDHLQKIVHDGDDVFIPSDECFEIWVDIIAACACFSELFQATDPNTSPTELYRIQMAVHDVKVHFSREVVRREATIVPVEHYGFPVMMKKLPADASEQRRKPRCLCCMPVIWHWEDSIEYVVSQTGRHTDRLPHVVITFLIKCEYHSKRNGRGPELGAMNLRHKRHEQAQEYDRVDIPIWV